MGIDIYARWPEQDDEARQAQMEAWLSTDAGHIGYIREAYHGNPYPSRHLMPEVFEHEDGVAIPAATLRERLPETLRLAAERERTVYRNRRSGYRSRRSKQYRDFVKLCENIEAKTGTPPTIFASW